VRASSKSIIDAVGIEPAGIESGAGAPSAEDRSESGSFGSVRNRVHLAVTPQRRANWGETGAARQSEVAVTDVAGPSVRRAVQAKPNQLR
jgi:hypothetical protein